MRYRNLEPERISRDTLRNTWKRLDVYKEDNYFEWRKSKNNEQHFIVYRNKIGEKEASFISNICKFIENEIKSNTSHPTKVEVSFSLMDLLYLSPTFVSEIFLLVNNIKINDYLQEFYVSIFLPFDEKSTYKALHLFGPSYHQNNTIRKRNLNIYRAEGKESISFYKLQTPSFVISDSFIPSIFIEQNTSKKNKHNSFKDFFQKKYALEDVNIDLGAIEKTALKNYENAKVLIKRIERIQYTLSVDKKINVEVLKQLENYLKQLRNINTDHSNFKTKITLNDSINNIKFKETTKRVFEFLSQNLSNKRIEELLKDNYEENKILSVLLENYITRIKGKHKSQTLISIENTSKKFCPTTLGNSRYTPDKLFNLYFKKIVDNTITYYNYKRKGSYIDELLFDRSFFQKLQNQSLFFLMLFQLILNESFLFKGKSISKKIVGTDKVTLSKTKAELNERGKNRIEKFSDFLQSIYYYTETIYRGIYEISKNIIDHSSQAQGVISISLSNMTNLKKIKNKHSYWINYLNKFESINNKPPNSFRFLDISIIDNGENGIIETTASQIQENNKSKDEGTRVQALSSNYDTLIQIINNSNTIKKSELFYKHFFKLSKDKTDLILLQLKKYAAGYGLGIFSAIIQENKGCFLVSSPGNFQNNDKSSYGFLKSFGSKPHYLETNLNGTQYNFIFPLINEKEGSFKDNLLYENEVFFDDDIFKPNLNFKITPHKKFLFQDIEIPTKKIELLSDSSSSSSLRSYLILDFGNLYKEDFQYKIDITDLLRFLAYLNLKPNSEFRNLIIQNISYEDIKELTELLALLYKYYHKTFWSNLDFSTQSILFYCNHYYLKISENGENQFRNGIITALLLAGDTPVMFLDLNNELSYYQLTDIPNEETIKSFKEKNNSQTQLQLTNKLKEYRKKSPLYINQTPIFFDMILRVSKYHTIFESNVHEQLTKKIR